MNVNQAWMSITNRSYQNCIDLGRRRRHYGHLQNLPMHLHPFVVSVSQNCFTRKSLNAKWWKGLLALRTQGEFLLYFLWSEHFDRNIRHHFDISWHCSDYFFEISWGQDTYFDCQNGHHIETLPNNSIKILNFARNMIYYTMRNLSIPNQF